MFDTGQASRTLGLPRYSLAYLLQYCCSVEADKKFQLADWRIRCVCVLGGGGGGGVECVVCVEGCGGGGGLCEMG